MSRPRSSRAADQLRYRLINCCSFVSGREAGHFYIGKALRSGMLAQSNSSDTAAATQNSAPADCAWLRGSVAYRSRHAARQACGGIAPAGAYRPYPSPSARVWSSMTVRMVSGRGNGRDDVK
jgi:hypothetical protein